MCRRKQSHKELPEKFSGKFEELQAKIFRAPKMCLHLHVWQGFIKSLQFARVGTCGWRKLGLGFTSG